MAQSVTVQAAQHPDTRAASPSHLTSASASASGLVPSPGRPALTGSDDESDYDQPEHSQHQDDDYDPHPHPRPHPQQQQQQQQQQQPPPLRLQTSQEPLVSPSQWQLPPVHEAQPYHRHGQPPSQPYRPESEARSPPPPPPPPPPLYSPRNTRSHSIAASIVSVGSQSSIRRKPLSPTASPLAVRFSSRLAGAHSQLRDLPQPESGFYSLDSPHLYDLATNRQEHVPAPILTPASTLTTPLEDESHDDESHDEESHHDESLDEESHHDDDGDDDDDDDDDGDEFEYSWPTPPTTGGAGPADCDTRNFPDANPALPQTDHPSQPVPAAVPLTDSEVTAQPAPEVSKHVDGEKPFPAAAGNRNTIMSMFSRKSIRPQLHLDRPDSEIRQASVHPDRALDSASSTRSSLNKPLPRSPPLSPARTRHNSSKLSAFFSWTQPSPNEGTITTTNIDDNQIVDHQDPFSPIPSPTSEKRHSFLNESPEANQQPSSLQHNARKGSALGYVEAYLLTPPNSCTQASPIVEIEEMEDELKAISAELASSIRREMDLEDLVERLQSEVNNPQAPGKRTSDYFSDSGYSSAKSSDEDRSKDEIAQVTRRAELEKAQLRLELTNKLQDERGRRNALDQQIRELADKASRADAAQMTSKDADVRVKELERTCEDLRRRLAEEKQVKDNFEDLLSALKGELQNAASERDNLRDEIVPQLKSRVEGLEAQQTENEKLVYDTAKLQQEIDNLKESKARNDSVARLRSSSITGQNFRLSRPPSVKGAVGLSRSNTVKSGQVESRDVLVERLKDVEAQRDALHNALKNLLDRQDFQNRENEKKIKSLEGERDKLLSVSPRKAGFEKEVTSLRDEVSTLRRRAEEAIEQKWQVEKGLIGLKSDLDRAEEEIISLKDLLKEKDILIPDSYSRYSSGPNAGVLATSSSLEKAYRDLQTSYQTALERITNMDLGGTSASQDERTSLAMKRLEQSLSAAMLERDDARLEMAALQDQVSGLEEAEKAHLAGEGDLADQLRDSANRVEELTQQVRSQLAVNASLRTRLSETIARGQATQQANKERLASVQIRMKTLEDQVVAAQTAAEERVNRHEEELAALREANNSNLQRLSGSAGALRAPRLFPPGTPMAPLLSPNGGTLPRLRNSQDKGSARVGPSTGESEQDDNNAVDVLKARIAELEKALVTADFEMQEVVNRMNTAQIDVMMLQEERETAARETKRLQQVLEDEQAKAEEVMNRLNTAQIDVMMLQEERDTAARETKKLQQALEAEQAKASDGRLEAVEEK